MAKRYPEGQMDKCCNGCNAPPQPPSRVLCGACLDALDARMNALLGGDRQSPEPPASEAAGGGE